jgi:Holliday junction DNA helicase RuvA
LLAFCSTINYGFEIFTLSFKFIPESYMIASLQGKLEIIGSDSVIVNVNGVGFLVYLPTSTLSSVGRIGKEVKLYTHLHVREDILALYGFSTPDELRLFNILLGVSGIGPKVGLSMLSAMSTDQLTMAIATGNADLLTSIPGIGNKTANRIVLELKDKIGAGWITTQQAEFSAENTDVLSALTSLGYSAAEAARAVASLPAKNKLSLEEKIKMALQYFSGK